MSDDSANKPQREEPESPVPTHTPTPTSAATEWIQWVGGEDSLPDVLQSTLANAKIGIWEANFDTGEALRSATHAEIFGCGEEEVTRWSFNDFRKQVHPEDQARVGQSISEGLKNGQGWNLECRILRRDKSLRWVAIRGAPIARTNPPCRRVRGVVMDITERKQAEFIAQETDRRFASLANSAPVLIWTSGTDKQCDFFNQPWLDFTGRSMEQELGNGWAEGLHPDDFERCLKAYVTHFDARSPFQIEYRLRRHDGAYRWILDHGIPRHLPDGSFVGYIGSCIDITEQRLDRARALEAAQAAEALRSTLEELATQQRVLLDASPLAIGLIRNRQIAWTNAAHEALLGYTGEEAQGMPTRQLFADDADYQRLGSEAYEALRRGETYTTDIRLRKKGGAVFWCQIVGKALSPSAAEGGSIWLLKDIEAIRRTEAQFRLQSDMLSHMGEGVVLVSGQSGRILHTNRMFDRMLGYGAGELHGQPVSVVNAPGESSREEIAAEIFAELNRHGSWNGDITNQRKDGATILCHASVSRFEHSEHGDVWMSVHTDITEARRMERELREAKDRYDDLVRHVPCGVQSVRLHPDGTYKFDFVSPITAQLIGVELDQLYQDATLWTRHTRPEDAAKAAAETARCIATKEPYKWEGRFEVAGTTRWLRFEGHPGAQAGGDVLWNAVVNDITEQKTLEGAQREAQKLTAIGHLAGGMAHEFNNILASMLMSIGLAKEDQTPSSIEESLRDLEKGCFRASGLIKQLLAFSQRSVLSSQRIELNDFVARQVPSLRSALGDSTRLEITNAKGSLWVSADGPLLHDAIRNLCENAGEAMGGRGVVQISLEPIEIGSDRLQTHAEARRGRFACLTISDQGCGMDSKTRARVFEPFFTTKAVGAGTGLGLASVLGIVRQHQGWVEVESEVGRGSCFRIHLPLSEARDNPCIPTAISSATTGAAATILLAEDDAGLRKVVSRVLKRAGYHVLEAQDAIAAQALWEANQGRIDLLLSDVVMPGGESGVQLARRLIEQRGDLKVILTSGYNTVMEDLPTELRHRIEYLAKPVQFEDLLRTVRESLHSSR